MKTINLRALVSLAVMLLAAPQLAHADWMADPTSINAIFDTMAASTSHIAASLQAIGIKLFFSLALLQLVITGYGLIASGDIEQSLGKYARSFIWISFCIWLMSNNRAYNFLANTIQYFLDHAIGWASGTQANFDVGGIVATGITAVGNVYAAVATAAIPKSSGVSAIVSYFTSGGLLQAVYGVTIMIFTVLLIAATCLYLALKVFMVKIEAMIVLAIMPLSLSFLGLNALRDQGFAPFKSVLALIYRIVILGAVTGGLAGASGAVAAYAVANPSATTLELGFCLSFGFVVLAFLAYKSDQIATSLANGSASMGSGDVAGAAMAAAAAAGAVTAGIGAVAGAGAGNAEKKGMGGFMKSLFGRGGTISNASTRGAGKTPEPAPARPLASLNGASSGNGTSSSAPTRSNANGDHGSASTSSAMPAYSMDSQAASASLSPGNAVGSATSQTVSGTSAAAPVAPAATASSAAKGYAEGAATSLAGPETSAASPLASAVTANSARGNTNTEGLSSPPSRTADNANADVGGADNSTATGAQRAADAMPNSGADGYAIGGVDTSMDPNAPRREKTSDKDTPPKRGDHKSAFGEHARNLGQQVAAEKQATSVSINTHQE